MKTELIEGKMRLTIIIIIIIILRIIINANEQWVFKPEIVNHQLASLSPETKE